MILIFNTIISLVSPVALAFGRSNSVGHGSVVSSTRPHFSPIVGTLDPEILWQDPRTFLYEEIQFRAYVRVPEAKFRKKWGPVKLTRVIRSISEEVGDRLSGMMEFGLKQAKEDSVLHKSTS